MTAINVPQQIVEGVHYYPRFLDDPDAALEAVREQVEFVQRERRMYGRTFTTPRQEAWYGPRPYRFGGSEMPAAQLPQILEALAFRAQCFVRDATFDSCLVNRYRDGNDSVSWHADDEPEMGDPIIASISLGAPRDFMFKRKDLHTRPELYGPRSVLQARATVTLEHGSLLVMHRGVQSEWIHCLPKRPKVREERINLTFRDCWTKSP